MLEGLMLCWISMVGGLLIMMGHHSRSEALFYYFRLEDQVPENHLLRLIDKHISFEFVREQLKATYSETGRPSIDPELLLRILLIGYLYGITSERKLVEELRMHLAWRWFTGLSFDQEMPPSLYLFQKPTRALSGVEAVRATVRTDRAAVRGSGISGGQAPVNRWQLRGSQRGQGEPHSTRTASASGTGPSQRASVSEGSGRAESGGGTGA